MHGDSRASTPVHEKTGETGAAPTRPRRRGRGPRLHRHRVHFREDARGLEEDARGGGRGDEALAHRPFLRVSSGLHAPVDVERAEVQAVARVVHVFSEVRHVAQDLVFAATARALRGVLSKRHQIVHEALDEQLDEVGRPVPEPFVPVVVVSVEERAAAVCRCLGEFLGLVDPLRVPVVLVKHADGRERVARVVRPFCSVDHVRVVRHAVHHDVVGPVPEDLLDEVDAQLGKAVQPFLLLRRRVLDHAHGARGGHAVRDGGHVLARDVPLEPRHVELLVLDHAGHQEARQLARQVQILLVARGLVQSNHAAQQVGAVVVVDVVVARVLRAVVHHRVRPVLRVAVARQRRHRGRDDRQREVLVRGAALGHGVQHDAHGPAREPALARLLARHARREVADARVPVRLPERLDDVVAFQIIVKRHSNKKTILNYSPASRLLFTAGQEI
ncbi:hypothetical protein KL929_003224 [Ogataea haglerorum]|nr:hypothetical protein KL929_003224 [Ogataea haglerorum]